MLNVKISYMAPKKVYMTVEELDERNLWIWPSKKDVTITDKSPILALRPVIEFAMPPSTNRTFVFRLMNYDILNKLSEM